MSALLAFVDRLVDLLVAHGSALLAGVSLVLLAGCLAMHACRHGAERRRLGLLTALASGAFLLLAIVPLPRWTPSDESFAPPAAPASTPVLAPPAAPVDPAVRIAALLAAIDELVPAVAAEAVAPAAATPLASPFAWARLAALGYLAAGALLLLRTALGALRLRWLLRSTQPGPQALARAAGLPPGTRLCITDRPLRPFCAGIRRPVVVLPSDLLAPARRAQALAVLRHEAAHLRARDPQAQLLLGLLAVPLGLHPLFWWLCRDVRFQSELLADDAAAGVAGADAYARSLLELAEGTNPAFAAAGTVPVFHRPSEFFRRIQMLLQRQGRLSPAPSRARRALHTLAACTFVVAAGGLFGVPLAAQDPTPTPAELREQNQRLRAELDALRAELRQLRDNLERGSQGMLERLLDERREAGNRDRRTESQPIPPDDLPTITPDGRLSLPPTNATEDVAAVAKSLKAALERRREATATAALPGTQDPATQGQDPTPAPNPGGVPVLRDVPLISRLFVDTNNDGLPDQAVQQDVAATAERTPAGSSAEATADLATRCLDLQGEIELAEANAANVEQLAAAGRMSTVEARQATVHLNTLKRKQAIVQRLIRGEIEATQSELQWLDHKKKEADKTERLRLDMQVQRASSRLEVLRAAQ